ncbi:hypothetical protein GmHk_10G029860 [Glycine max]|nr:hypothetical protein GmHk_10G029860 [Glycine max]
MIEAEDAQLLVSRTRFVGAFGVELGYWRANASHFRLHNPEAGRGWRRPCRKGPCIYRRGQCACREEKNGGWKGERWRPQAYPWWSCEYHGRPWHGRSDQLIEAEDAQLLVSRTRFVGAFGVELGYWRANASHFRLHNPEVLLLRDTPKY